MKATRFIATAFVLFTVLSCQKEEQQSYNTEELSQGEIITCSFGDNESDTKTIKAKGGVTIWSAGDEIMLYDGVSHSQKLTLALNGDASSTTGVIKKDATKFTFVKPSGWTNVYAIYPYGACVSEFSPSAPKLNFANQDGTFGKANISAAVEVSSSMSFKNVGAILFHVRKDVAVNATNIVVPVDELANDYQVSFTEGMPTLTPMIASRSNSYDIGNNNNIYIGVPAGCTIPKGSAFLYRTSAKAIINSYITGASNTTERNKQYTLPEITADGKLPGVFSVSAEKKVRFSKGNLRYTVENTTWSFYDNQYDCASGYESSVVSLFTWGYNATKSIVPNGTNSDNVSRTSGDLSQSEDWGCTIGDGNTWRTLTTGEWQYLLSESPTGRGKGDTYFKKGVTVCGKSNCLVIAPDGNTTSIASSYDATAWATAEANGFVCLPAADSRDGSEVECVGEFGFYWSSTAWGQNDAHGLSFSDSKSSIDPNFNGSRCFGSSVRLVTVIQ